MSVGFGSMTGAERTAQIALDALKKSGRRGLLVSGSTLDLPGSVFQIDYAPYDWLFSRMAAVVHHGGAGTSAQAWRAGVPSVIVPFVLDQFYWGQRAARLGIAPPPLPSKNLNVDRLADAIQTVTTDNVLRRRAAELGEKIRAEKGVTSAVEIIDQHLRSV